MKSSKKYTIRLLGVVALTMVTATVFAAGFGVQGSDSQSQAVSKLLAAANVSDSNATAQTVSTDQQTDADQQASQSQQQQQQQQQQQPQSQRVQDNAHTPSGDDALGSTSTSRQAFANTVQNMMPMSPSQIKTLRYMFDQSQKAASAYPGTPPRPTETSIMVNLSPGATPPVIRLRAGFVTSLVFLDSTGQPWPVVAYDIGDPQAFTVEPTTPTGKSDTIMVQALDTYKSGNLAVMLKGENTPIMLTLMPGQRAVDYRVDLRVPGFGPNAKPLANGMPNTVGPEMLTFLNGIAPHGAKRLQLIGGDGQAWLYDKHLYLRTGLTVLSPSWLSTMSSPDGTHVYKMAPAPIVLASDNGATVQLKVQGL